MTPPSARHRVWLLIALVVPLLAIIGLVVRSEILLRGQEWRFRIRGYDPRDMLRGNYIDLNIEWGTEESLTVPSWDERCLCLKRDNKQRRVLQITCTEPYPCDVRLDPEERRALTRFFIPENPERAREIEQALGQSRGELVLIEKLGKLSIKELLIDGRPWKLYSKQAQTR